MIEFWLKNEAEGTNLLLPITPPEYTVAYEREIEVIRSMEQGDINLSGHKVPQSMNISGFFPTREYPFERKATVPISGVMDYIHLIQKWIDNDAIIRLVIADEGGRLTEPLAILLQNPMHHRQCHDSLWQISHLENFHRLPP